MTSVLWLLVGQGMLGASDVLINHEWRERLPQQATAATEQLLHGVRELLYALVFAGLAWCLWHGTWAWLFALVLLTEIVLTGWDFVQEDRTRVLSATERLMHLVLSMGGGAYCALLIPHLLQWAQQPTGLVVVHYGAVTWLLSGLAIGVFSWGVRDLQAGFRLRKKGNIARQVPALIEASV
ncbi:MAG TPA: hypothetical protein VFX11_19060 [Candidatus Kapabacteria bacterium]|nr:hypothetical protein [Candidatus Kapabacteria bacterium]